MIFLISKEQNIDENKTINHRRPIICVYSFKNLNSRNVQKIDSLCTFFFDACRWINPKSFKIRTSKRDQIFNQFNLDISAFCTNTQCVLGFQMRPSNINLIVNYCRVQAFIGFGNNTWICHKFETIINLTFIAKYLR